MTDLAQRATAQARRECLSRLVEELTRRGFHAELGASRTGVPLAHVVNPQASALSETVFCTQDADGSLWLAWPWGKLIAPADQNETAACVIARVLGTGRGIVAEE